MHPIPQRLALHAAPLRRLCARTSIEDQRDGQQAPDLRASRHFAAIARSSEAECSVRVIPIGWPIPMAPVQVS
jgi:hypothetical protein